MRKLLPVAILLAVIAGRRVYRRLEELLEELGEAIG